MCMRAWLHLHICTVFVVEWQQVSSASFAQAKFEFNSLVFCSLANTTSKFWHDLYRQHLLCFPSSQLVLSSLLLFYFPSPPSFYLYPTFVFSPTSLALSAQLLFFSTFPLLHSSVLPLFSDLHLPLRHTHSHTPSVCQQHLSNRVFTTPISPQRANLLYHRAHNSRIPAAAAAVCLCGHTHFSRCCWLLSKLSVDWPVDALTTTPSAMKWHFMVGLEFCVCVRDLWILWFYPAHGADQLICADIVLVP